MRNYQTYKFNDVRREINRLVCSGISEKEALSMIMQKR